MAEETAIEWADSTFNPWMGCTKVSPACDHCYAETLMDKRHGKVQWGPHGERVRTSASNWQNPVRWQKKAAEFFAEHGRRRRVFCASLADVFDNKAPAGAREDLWALIRATPDLDWLLLTKRPQNIAKMLPEFWAEIRGHVWLGTSTENQQEAERRLPHLLTVSPRPAVFFASAEPLLGPINFHSMPMNSDQAIAMGHYPGHTRFDAIHPKSRNRLDWIIAGGESGPGARPTNPQWYREIQEQCAHSGVAFLFKQWGEWVSVSEVDGAPLGGAAGFHTFEGLPIEDHNGRVVKRVGKKKAGRTLDGFTYTEFPFRK